MKILVFHTYNQGYLSSFFHELSIKFIQEGHEVVSFSWKASVSEHIIDGVKVVVKRKQGYLTNYRNIYNIIKKEQPDVTLSNFSYVNPTLLFGKLFGVKKSMVWFHSLNEQMSSSKRNIFIKKQFLKLTDVVIANSYLTKQELQHYYGVPETKIHAVPFWSTITEQETEVTDIAFASTKNAIKIGCPGRMATHKNHKILIEALSYLKNTTDYSFQLYFAGDGEEFTNLQKQAQELQLSNEVSFLKHLTANDMLHFYNNMDVVVLPSFHEAFGLVFIEAIALGIPVVVSNAFGALGFIDTERFPLQDFSFNPYDISELIDKLEPYIENKGLKSDYFKMIYHATFQKDVIYNQIKAVILNLSTP